MDGLPADESDVMPAPSIKLPTQRVVASAALTGRCRYLIDPKFQRRISSTCRGRRPEYDCEHAAERSRCRMLPIIPDDREEP